LKVQFTDTSKGTPTSWSWDFGDGTTSTDQNPTHTYSTAGNYTVSLTASNKAGSNTVMESSYIVVTALKTPVASFSSDVATGYAPLSVAFTDTSTGTPTSWIWSFGDGASSTDKNPVHTYSKAGKYTVSLTVRNAAGSNAVTKSSYINIANALMAPVASFSASPTAGNTPLRVSFTDISTGTPISWNWNFGDGTSSTQKSPTHTYSAAGSYTVVLTVSNATGSNTVKKSNYIVANPSKSPVAAFSASTDSGKAPLTVRFNDQSTGSPTSWKWDFGDKIYSTAKNPVHKYSKKGNYTVSLTVKNTAGSNTLKKTSYITVK